MTFAELTSIAERAIHASDRQGLQRVIARAERLAMTYTPAERDTLTAMLLHWRGFDFFTTAHYREAMALFEQALERFISLHEHRHVARVCTNIGACHQFLGNYTDAHAWMTRAYDAYEQLEDHNGMATVLGNLGNLMLISGNYESALDHYTRAVEVHRELADDIGTARATGNIGSVHKETGSFATALEFYGESLRLYRSMDNRAGIARVTGNIGECYYAMSDYANALEHYTSALDQYEELGDRFRAARLRSNIAGIYLQTKDYETALSLFRDAFAVLQEIGDSAGIAHITGAIGETLQSMGQTEESLTWLRSAVERSIAVGNKRDEVFFLQALSGAYLECEMFDDARAILEHADDLAHGLPTAQLAFASNRARLLMHDQKFDDARRLLEHSLESAHVQGLREYQQGIHLLLREVHRTSGPLERYVFHNEAYERISNELRGEILERRLAIATVERRAAEERRKTDRQRLLLYNALPAPIADRLLDQERDVADLHEHAVVLFADIVSFTSIASALEPRALIVLLNRIFSVCDDICHTYGLTKIKTIGDAYMAVAFPDTEHQIEVASALAALEMLDAIQSIQPDLTSPDRVLRVRMGLHCGPVIAGVIGTERLQYDVWGDTVNVASRMESSSESGRIHVSAEFAHALPPSQFVLTERGETSVKGKGVMTTYWLQGHTA